MADAKKCDRCGAFYMENKVERFDEFNNKCHPAQIKVIGDNGGVISIKDLCDDCGNDFVRFMARLSAGGEI
jgi:rRNA maturation protein Nop10